MDSYEIYSSVTIRKRNKFSFQAQASSNAGLFRGVFFVFRRSGGGVKGLGGVLLVGAGGGGGVVGGGAAV